MTQGVKDLIAAIAAGDSVAIDAAWNAEMATRISSKLDDMRVSVAKNMFATEQAVDEQEPESTEVEATDEAEETPEQETVETE
jgi:hypothetical protein